MEAFALIPNVYKTETHHVNHDQYIYYLIDNTTTKDLI